jgi:predicted transcriptional regulator
MGKKISEDIIKQIPILYKELGTKKKVAEQLGISATTVNKYLTLYEANPLFEPAVQKERKPKTTITQEIIDKINKRYSECMNMSQVARELNISSTIVKKYLSEDNLKLKENQNNDRDVLFFYIYRLFGQYSEEQAVNPWNITQMQKFKSQGYPYRGQYLALKYFFEVEKSDIDKAHGSIGIIPYVWTRAQAYYEQEANRIDNISSLIEKQLEQDRISININPSDYFNRKKKKIKPIDLSTLED